jgi:hypothetical protein
VLTVDDHPLHEVRLPIRGRRGRMHRRLEQP